MSKQQIGVVGMAVMGRNLALNIESRGYTVSIFNRSRRGQFGYRELLYYKGFPGMSTPVFTVSVCTIVKK